MGTLVPPALGRWTGAGPWPWPASTCATSPSLNYQHHLFQERTLRSVTANTRADGEEFLALAADIGVRVSAVPYPFERADRALGDLAHDRVDGAAVLRGGGRVRTPRSSRPPLVTMTLRNDCVQDRTG